MKHRSLPIRCQTDRYTDLALPPYRFVPGQTPQPRKSPQSYAYQQPEPAWPTFDPENWQQSTGYLYGIDLFNATLWWESHEQWESLWRGLGRHTVPALFLRGLIQLAAAHLRHAMGTLDGSRRLWERAKENFRSCPDPYCGILLHQILQYSALYLKNDLCEPTILSVAYNTQSQRDSS